MSPYHYVTYSGFMPNRYSEHQLPFFGFSTAYMKTTPLSLSAQLDLRYSFLRKNYVTLRGGLFTEGYLPKDLLNSSLNWAVGTEYARQTMVGPLKFAVQWNSMYGVNMYASIGFDF